jgi:hypothetical protein
VGSERLSQIVWDIVTFVASFVTLWLEAFLRRDFGERYISNGVAIVSALLFFFNFIGLTIVRNLFNLQWTLSFYLIVGYWVVFVLVVIGHRFEIRRRNLNGERWHSWYRGTSWLRTQLGLPLADRHFKLLVEPVIGLLLALIAWYISRPLALAFGVSAIALFIKEANIQASFRQQYLDIVDAQIAADGISELAEHGWEALDGDPNDLFQYEGYTAFMPAQQDELPDFINAVAATSPLVAERLKQMRETQNEAAPEAE